MGRVIWRVEDRECVTGEVWIKYPWSEGREIGAVWQELDSVGMREGRERMSGRAEVGCGLVGRQGERKKKDRTGERMS